MDVEDLKSPQLMVFEALQCLCSQNADILKSAESKLAQWETQQGFYTTITRIMFAHKTVDTNVRWMATIYLKNGITKYWRKNAPNAIAIAERNEIKQTLLLETFREPIPQIAIQMAVIIGNMSRLDYPNDWNELMPRLNQMIGSSDQMEQYRAMLVLQQVIQALASKRLHHDRRVFRQLTTELYPCVFELWKQYTQQYLQSISENGINDLSQNYIEKALITLRILRKLTIYGVIEPLSFEPCFVFLNSIIPCLKKIIVLRAQLISSQQMNPTNVNTSAIVTQIIESTEKFVLKMMKLFNEFLETHTRSFIDFIPAALEFAFDYVFYTGTQLIFDAQNQINFPNFAINCINLMKNIAMKSSNEDDAPIKTDATNDFFTVERLNYINEKVLTYYFLLTPQDLEAWNDDPEQYARDECGEYWKYDLRPCTESFYLTLFSQYRTDMIVDLTKFIRKAQEITLHDGSDSKDIFLKDAIYKAAGLSAFNLFDEIDFNEWFTKQLLHELNLKGELFRIIRRRVIWLIAQWISVKFDRSLRPKVYEACLHLIQPDEDMCVRMAACKTLMSTLGDFDFESSQFLEYVQSTFSSLFTLLKEAAECDTKMVVLNVMSFLVDKVGDDLMSHALSLCHYLPLLWNESQDHSMLRCAILSTLLQIIVSISEIPSFLSSFLYPVIAMSTNKDEPSHVYFMEDALELWLVFIANSATLTPELLQLSQNLLPIIEYTSENIRTCFEIMQAYILLNAEIYLQQYGKDIVKTCMGLLSDLRSEGIVMVMRMFDSIIRSSSHFGIELLRPALPDIFKRVADNDEWQMVMSSYLTIVARVLIIDQMVFIQVLQELNVANPLDTILDIWLKKMPLIGQPDKQKLLSLALASLLTAQNDSIYKRFDAIIQCICETLNDIMRENEDDVMVDSLIFTDDTPLDDDSLWKTEHAVYSTHHYERCRELCMKDPVHTIVLKTYFESQLEQANIQLGNDRFKQLLATIDDAVIKNLSEYHIRIK